ncbi:2-iminobutanoate/2-iminopropanoate deaminase-like isoform X1 [Hydractinia symbiolongicarpus]|uniref:2-iminobutanoate/2-iminopropanoate deaminase-like isoform X1 n=1 Tax=Hydractinia symbiolongicarpus TaxID=13093 RepID=UPI00254C83F9|nr:2-iminobutanoate/2-iminopropanoate deaminase-like isoform X1 [Hydractinia symbiolongicarpus]
MSKIIRKVISTVKAPKAIGPYSQAVQVNHMLHISGQLGLNPETMDFVSNDVQEQTKQALTNMKAILEAAGSSFANVVETTILLADINDYKAVNDVYATFFKAPFPARAAFECANLPKRGKVEIRAKAIVGPLEDIELSSKL